GGTNMQHIMGADGMDCMIDHSNPNIMFYTRQYGTLVKSTNGGNSFTGIQPLGSSGAWVTPLIMDPSNANILYAGYSDVYKSTNGGSSWTNTGVDGSSAMAMGTSNTNRIYAASGAAIWRSDNAAGSWSSINAGLPNRSITGIAVNPDNSLDVFVTVADYVAGQKVYASSNGGASWTNISDNLPNTIINCIAYEDKNGSPDNALYIGTDIGVYYRNETLGFWIPFMNGLPTVPVFDLEINYASNSIRAGTYGRGLWSSELYSACPTAYLLTPGNDPGNPNYTGVQNYEASSSINSSRVITGGVGTNVSYKAGNYILLTEGFNAKENNLFKAWLGPCQVPLIAVSGTYAGATTE
ncbi:MAG: hypothetical protein PHX54_11610, partial [Lentimicrobiaceae bacterium]|nr:hypothetical protein [Lentimicrobiaceae bacterium]